MEVVRPPVGFLLPHRMYHGTRRPTTSPAGGRRRPRIRTAPHEFYDGSWPTRGVDEHVDDDGLFFHGVPASASAVAGLPRTTAEGPPGGGERRRREEEEESACGVCLEGYADGDAVRTMPCAHAFHEGCIVEWLSVSSLCPLCRFKLPTQAEDAAAQQAPDLI